MRSHGISKPQAFWMRLPRQTFCLAVLFTVWLGITSTGSANASEIPIFGQVTDHRGRPIAEAEISLWPLSSPIGQAVANLSGEDEAIGVAQSDADGSFEILAPEPGMWTLRASKIGHAPLDIVLPPVLESTVLPPARLNRSRPLKLRLRDSEGKKIAARVRLSKAPDKSSSMRWRGFQIETWKTADLDLSTDTGDLTVPLDPDTEYLLEAIAENHVPYSKDLTSSNRKTLRVQLTKSAPLAIQAIDSQGKPVAGAIVFLDGSDFPLAETDLNGNARLMWPPKKEAKLRILTTGQKGHFDLPEDLEEKAPAVAIVELEEQPTSSGKVLDNQTRDPITNAIVLNNTASGEWSFSDSAGRYILPLNVGKSRVLRAVARNYQEAIEWTEGAEARAPTFSLEPATTLTGKVVDADQAPVLGAKIEVRPNPGNRRRMSRMTSEKLARSTRDGRFSIGGLNPDQGVELRVSKQGFGSQKIRLDALVDQEPLVVVLPKGLIGKGRVVTEDDFPLAGTEIFLRPADQDQSRRWRFVDDSKEDPADATADAEGFFEIRDMAIGRFDLEARATGFAPTQAPGLEIPEGVSLIDLGTLIMTPGAKIEGEVFDPEGNPIADASILLVEQRSRMPAVFLVQLVGQQPPDTTTGADGGFSISDRSRGDSVHLVVGKDGFLPQVLASVLAPTEPPVQITLRRGSKVSGRVVDSSGLPVAATLVMVHPEGRGSSGRYSPTSRQGTSDEDGLFEVDEVEPGNVTITARAAGFQELQLSGLQVPADQPLEDVELELESGATIRGKVTLPDGSPASEAFVMLGDNSGIRQNKGFATTDGEGQYELTGLPFGNHRLSASDADGRRASTSVVLDRDEIEVDLVFDQGIEISGWVRNEQGQPVPGAEIYLREVRRTTGFRMGNLGSTSGADGTFKIEDVRPGSYRLRASKDGFVAQEDEDILEVDTVALQGIEVVLSRGATIKGQILGLEYDEMVQVQVRGLTRGSQVTRPNYEGQFTLPNMPFDSVTIEAEIPGTGRQVQEVVTIPEGTLEVEQDLEFGTGYTLTGSVFHADSPLSGVNVYLSRNDGPGNSSTVTGQDGSFRLEGLEEGTYTLRVRSFESGLSDRREIEILGDDDIRIEIFTGRISGFVRDADDSTPINDAALRLESADPENPGLRDQASSDVRGYFSFGEVSEGRFNIRAIKTGYGTDEITVEVVSGSSIDDVELALEATEGIRFDVVQSSGRPLQGVRAAVLGPSGERVANGIFDTTDGKHVEISTVPPGSWELVIQGGESAVSSFQITSPGNPGLLTLLPASTLQISVAELQSDGARATARLSEAAGTPYRRLTGSGNVQSEIPINRGHLEVSDLTPGFWTVTIEAADGRTWSGSAQVGAGAAAQLEIP